MIADPVLLIVVGADFLGAVAGADLATAQLGGLGVGLLLLELQEAALEHPKSLVLVLELALLVLHRHDDTGRNMRDPNRRVHRVYRLATRPRGPVGIDPKIVVVNLHLDLVGFRDHQYRRR